MREIHALAGIIESCNLNGMYRKVPVTFADGTLVGHDTIEQNMNRLFKLIDELDDINDVDAFVKAFLDIHPFIDGNGRAAFILYNWLRGALDSPDNLPDYYGKPPLLQE